MMAEVVITPAGRDAAVDDTATDLIKRLLDVVQDVDLDQSDVFSHGPTPLTYSVTMHN